MSSVDGLVVEATSHSICILKCNGAYDFTLHHERMFFTEAAKANKHVARSKSPEEERLGIFPVVIGDRLLRLRGHR